MWTNVARRTRAGRRGHRIGRQDPLHFSTFGGDFDIGGASVVPIGRHRSSHALLTELDREVDQIFGQCTAFDHVDRTPARFSPTPLSIPRSRPHFRVD